MPRLKGFKVSELTIDGDKWSVRATNHALDQCNKRSVAIGDLGKTIKLLGRDGLKELQTAKKDVIVVHDGLAIVFGFSGNRIMIITVVNKQDVVFGKKRTIVKYI